MATDKEFGALLREYAPNEMLVSEVEKVSWIIKKVKKDKQWGLGPYKLPTQTAGYSRMEWGALPASNDIPSGRFAVPQVSEPAELFGALKFTNKDLAQHDGDLKKSFLKSLKGQVPDFTEYMAEMVNSQFLNGSGAIAVATGNGAVGGTIALDRVGHLRLGQKVRLQNLTGGVNATGYIRAINKSNKQITVFNVAAPTGGAAVDLSTITTANKGVLMLVGAQTERITSLIDIIFSAADGGADTLYGGTLVKAEAPIYQALTRDLSAANTGATLIAGIFDVYYDYVDQNGGKPSLPMGFLPMHAFKAVAKLMEPGRQYLTKDEEVVYGADAIKIMGPYGSLYLKPGLGMSLTHMIIVDWAKITLASKGELIQNAAIEGEEFYRERNTSGYTYIVDKKFQGELITLPGYHAGAKLATSIT